MEISIGIGKETKRGLVALGLVLVIVVAAIFIAGKANASTPPPAVATAQAPIKVSPTELAPVVQRATEYQQAQLDLAVAQKLQKESWNALCAAKGVDPASAQIEADPDVKDGGLLTVKPIPVSTAPQPPAVTTLPGQGPGK